ncbi:putative thiamine transporter SLC35F3 [Liparis tanakae]|uniref:Putative thiamine transporter SLC35F3 n=1 Tax=Liparis tanakae TaxID=230148 RepID=A0A4Z2HCC6_9TELE|nr:putative thiamine transporter SLC35F3 [Liparis tanakae]
MKKHSARVAPLSACNSPVLTLTTVEAALKEEGIAGVHSGSTHRDSAAYLTSIVVHNIIVLSAGEICTAESARGGREESVSVSEAGGGVGMGAFEEEETSMRLSEWIQS